jgi:ubiquinone/menaquinone biosynthesis C-methylase UbiE
MKSDSLYLEGEEKFGPLSSFFYGVASPLLRKYYKTIFEYLKGKNFDSLLDIGCGPGNVVIKLAGIHPKAHFYCIDPSPNMIKLARKNIDRNYLDSRITAITGSSRSIPFDQKFDAIISSFSYHHWKDRDQSLKTLPGLLSKGGFLTIFEYDNDKGKLKNSHGISEREWDNLEIGGFHKTVEHTNGLIILTIQDRVLA